MTDLEQKVTRTASEAARRTFSPGSLINRLDMVVAFSPLNREQLCEILEVELHQVQMRILQTAKVPFLFRVGAADREFLLGEEVDARDGARHFAKFKGGHREVLVAHLPIGKRAGPNGRCALRRLGQTR